VSALPSAVTPVVIAITRARGRWCADGYFNLGSRIGEGHTTLYMGDGERMVVLHAAGPTTCLASMVAASRNLNSLLQINVSPGIAGERRSSGATRR
jgi:hypothetical protein